MGKSIILLLGAVFMLVVGMVTGSSNWVAASMVLNILSLGENSWAAEKVQSKLDDLYSR